MRNIAKISILLFCVVFFAFSGAQAQDENSPVLFPWATTMLIDQQTVVTPQKGTLEMKIHHRFGKIEKISDLLGIYAPSNIRMGVDYGVTNKLMLGFGTEKNNKVQQFELKYSIADQTDPGGMPVGIAYYASLGIDARDEAMFGYDYKFTNRLSYFHQVIISRMFSDKVSMQLAPSYSHFNAVDYTEYDSGGADPAIEPAWQNDMLGLMVGGRVKVHNEIAFVFEYNQPFALNPVHEEYQTMPKPGIGLGAEFGTATHCFHVFASNYDEIINQNNQNFNTNELGDLMFGFNITVRF